MVARSVEVDFDAEVGGFVAGLAEADAALGKVDRKLSDLDGNDSLAKLGEEALGAGAGLTGLGRESDKTREKVTEHGREIDKFAQKLDLARAEAKRLGQQFLETGDADVLKAWRKASRDVSTLDRVGKSLGLSVEKGVGDGGKRGMARIAKDSVQEAEVVSKTFGNGILSGFMELPPQMKAALVGGAIAAMPVIGAAINSAVLLGVGGGALGTALLLAAQDQRVKSAGTALGQHVMAGLQVAAAPVIAHALSGVDIISKGFDTLQPRVARIFANIAPETEGLAHGVVGFLDRAMPGIEHAVNAAKPLLDALAKEAPKLGSAISDFLDEVSAGGPGAVAFFHDLMTVVDSSLRSLGAFLEITGKIYKGLADIRHGVGQFAEAAAHAASSAPALGVLGAQLDKDADAANRFSGAMSGAGVTLEKGGQAGTAAGRGLAEFAGALTRAVPQVLTLHQALGELKSDFEELSDKGISSAQAAIGWKTALAALTESVKANGRSLDINTAAGRANQQTIINGVEAARRSYEANRKQGDSINVATGKYRAQISALRDHLLQLGFNRAAVDKLIRALGGVPPHVKTKAEVATAAAHNAISVLQRAINNVHGKQVRIDAATGAAQRALDAVRGALAGINSKTVYVNVRGSHTALPQRWGGIDHAATGLLRAGIYTRPMVSFAEPETGGEAFVPRLGDYRRSTAILDQAARWYGGRFAAGGGSVDYPAIQAMIRQELRGITISLDGRVLGRVLGGQADLRARAG